MTSPLHTYAGLLERSTHLVHAFLHNDPMVPAYQVWGHRTINDAYGDPLNSGVGGAGPLAMFQVNRGDSYRSETLRRKRLGLVEENRRGTTHYLFDVDDFIAPAVGGSPIPDDGGWMFLRMQENRGGSLLAFAGVPEATITLAAVVATDQVIIKGVYFEFAAGANNLAHAGTIGDPFIVGLGADDDAAAANLTLALNDAANVGAALDLIAPLNTHTFGTNVGAPSAVVLVQPEDAGANLIPGNTAQFTITTADAPRVAIDAAALALGTLVTTADATTPVLGPIYCVPPAAYFGTMCPTLTLQGIAPSGSASAIGTVPDLDENLESALPRAMVLVFPKPLTALSIRNLSAVNLLVAFGPGQLMRNVPAGGELPLYSGTTKMVVLACPDGVVGAAFSLHGVTSGEALHNV